MPLAGGPAGGKRRAASASARLFPLSALRLPPFLILQRLMHRRLIAFRLRRRAADGLAAAFGTAPLLVVCSSFYPRHVQNIRKGNALGL